MKILFSFWGKVRAGAKRGRLLGFPTANIALHKTIPEGIYASQVSIRNTTKIEKSDAQWYPAATFIGSAKTFGEKDYKAETYILDFSKNVYGELISIKLYKKIRGNQKFTSGKELIKQMENDIQEVRKYFKLSHF